MAIALIAAGTLTGCATHQAARQTARGHPVGIRTPFPVVTMPNATPLPTREPLASSAPPTPAANTNSGAPKLAIIIDDCGQWLATERDFIALPVPLTLSVLPDMRYTAQIANEASDAGKGVMLHLPMETVSGLDPGPGKITTEMSDVQIAAQVTDDLAQVPLAQGINNHEGSKATADARVMRDVAAAIVKHGNLFFIDSLTTPDSVAQQQAQAAGLPTAARDVFLDNKADVDAIETQLRTAAGIAGKRGAAIAIGHPRPATLEAVRAMLPELQREGINLVLAQDLVR